MMSLAEIRRLDATLDHARRSPVADAVASGWGFAPGLARHLRSSASHVFTLESPDGRRVYLRFVPADYRPQGAFARVAELMRDLGARGLAVAQPIATDSGALVETVATSLGPVHAMVVRQAPGEQIDADALDARRASAWGAALARLHRDGGQTAVGANLPGPFAQLDPKPAPATQAFAGDPDLADAAEKIARRLEELPRGPDVFGVVHGDFELDNLCWTDDRPVAYDFDEAARSWFVADLAHATRDLAPLPPRTPRPDEADLFAAFLSGYRQVHALAEAQLAWLPLFVAAHAACSVVRVRAALGEQEPDEPPWQVRLRRKLIEYADRQRRIALIADL